MRVAAFDLETSDLRALFGRILCCGIKPICPDEPAIVIRGDQRPYKERDPISDKALCVGIRNALENYNMVVAWNGRMFDIPFLNARLLKHNERPFRPQFVFDPMYQARGTQLRIGSSKLVNVQKYFGFPNAKTEIDWETWQRAGLGDKRAMEVVAEHCRLDCDVLVDAYWKLLPLVGTLHR